MIPDLTPVRKSFKKIELVFDEELAQLVDLLQDDADTEAQILVKAARIMRREDLTHKNSFTGSLPTNCEKNSVSELNLNYWKMRLSGASKCENDAADRVALSMAQLESFNTVHQRTGKTGMYH